MAPEPDVPGDGALEVDGGVEGEGAEVGTAEGFGRDANFEGGAVEGGDGEAGACMRLVEVGEEGWRRADR